MKIVFFGPPGSGKGTQAKIIADYLRVFHLSTGDILRNKLKDGDNLSEQLNEIISGGNLVSDNLLNEIIAEKLSSKECGNGFILDGYPRTINQSDFLFSFFDKRKIVLDLIFEFKINFKIVKERILNRSHQEKRSDDNLKAIKTRLKKYMKDTYPVSRDFRSKFSNNYFTIDASQEISQIQKDIMKIIKNGEN